VNLKYLTLIYCFSGLVKAYAQPSLSTLVLKPGVEVSGFTNYGACYGSTSCVGIYEPHEAIEAFFQKPARIEIVKSIPNAYYKKIGILSFPRDIDPRDKKSIIDHVGRTGEKASDVLNASGAIIIDGRLLFWRLVSDQSLLLCTSRDASGEMILITK